MTKTVALALGLGLLAGRGGAAPDPITITNGQGEMAGEVTADSVIPQETLLASDAAFKILISPTPMIGPDDADQAGRQALGLDPFKRDNHSNLMGFRYERDWFFDRPAAFRWFDEHGVPTYETVRTAG